MAEVKSAQVTISEHWHDHVHHKTVGKAPRWDSEQGVICACGEVLGWPDPERKETLSAYTRRVASERVDAASAPGRVKGAFGEYTSTPVPTDDPVEHRDIAAVHAADTAEDPGPEEPPEPDWGEPPEDEPEPVVLTVDRDTPKVVDVQLPESAGPLAGEVTRKAAVIDALWNHPDTQAAVREAEKNFVGPEWGNAPDEAQSNEVAPRQVEYAATPLNEGIVEPEEDYEIGRGLVPYAGTPIVPAADDSLDPLNGPLAPIDPSLPYTPADVELKIIDIMRQIQNSEIFLRQQLQREHQATHNYKMRYNLALKQSSAPNSGKQTADAVLATERESYEMTEAQALVRALRDALHNLRSLLSGHQSVAKSLAVSLTNSLDGRDMPRPTTHREPPEPPPWEYQ